MNSIRTPCCSRCETNYHIGDIYGPKIPILLKCGHDMCRSCINLMYKRNKQIICEICNDDTKIESDDNINNLQIHYYIVGKLWYLFSNKAQQINQDISNLKMTNEMTKSTTNNCKKCQIYTHFICHQCNEIYCEDCFNEVHLENQILFRHQIDRIDTAFPQEFKCNQHLKLINFVCVTCQLEICSNCAIDNHQPTTHEVLSLDTYNLNTILHLAESKTKANTLLKTLQNSRDGFNQEMLQYQNIHTKKNNGDLDKKKEDIALYVTSLVGILQYTEQMLCNKLDKAHLAIADSIGNVIFQLNNFINGLKDKLNKAEQLIKCCRYSSPMMMDLISDIESMLNATFYVAKKNKIKLPLIYDQNIFEAVQRCIITDFDIADLYLLSHSPKCPSDYTLTSMIDVTNNNLILLPEHSKPDLFISNASSFSNISETHTIDTFSKSSQNLDYSSTFSSSLKLDNSGLIISNRIPNSTNCITVKDIVEGQSELVVITHINSPSDFYLQLVNDKYLMDMVDEKLHGCIQTEYSIVDNIKMDNVVYAIKTNSNTWCRGVIVHMNKEYNQIKYTVHLIDYGYTQITTADRIRDVPSSVMHIPPLAYNCALYDLKPSEKTGWTNESYNTFCRLILEKQGTFIMYPMKIDCDPIQVDVVWKNDINPLSIRDVMFQLGYGSSEQYINKELHEKLMKAIKIPKSVRLEKGYSYNIILTHFISPNEFYLRINDDQTTNILEKMMKTLESTYKPTEIDLDKKYLLYSPQIGMAVAARFSIDNNWYRAKIISLPEPRMVTVFYIDFGNSETLPWDQLRVLERDIIEILPLAIKSFLADVCPAVNGIESDKWSDNACAEFIKLLKCGCNNDDNLTAFIHEVDDDIHKVILYNRTSRGEICVNRKLIIQGHANVTDVQSFSFNKPNKSNFIMEQRPIQMYSKYKEVKCSKDHNGLECIKQKPVIDSINHVWTHSTKKNQNTPGIKMSVLKIISPNEIILKYFGYNANKLTEHMNSIYNDKKKITKINWAINDLCAIFIQKFCNWYRGKIVKVDEIKQIVSVNLYDLNEVYDEIPVDTLHILEPSIVKEQCGILHCCMSNLVPLGGSDGKWSRFSCDYIIEKLQKYPFVYLAKKGKKDDIIFGEIWVKDIGAPQALEPCHENWINVNQYMIEQGYAISNEQNVQIDEYSTLSSESEFKNSFETPEFTTFQSTWLPPIPINVNKFKSVPMYVDMECNVYLQIKDNDTDQLLQKVMDELNSIYYNSLPEPISVKWSEGQMVIVKYHLDKQWYRGTILQKTNNGKFNVQFLDYGNIEICSHVDLRSTLYLTDIPQLCIKGYLDCILPMTEDRKWPIHVLDKLHSLIVDTLLTVTIDLKMSSNNFYIIKHMQTDEIPDIYQYMVTNKLAYFEFMNPDTINFKDYSSSINSVMLDAIDLEEKVNVNSDNAIGEICANTFYSNSFDSTENSSVQNIVHIETDYNKEEINCNVLSEKVKDLDSESSYNVETKYVYENKEEINLDTFGILKYTRINLERNKHLEGSLYEVLGPTQMIMVIEKINGLETAIYKKKINNSIMLHECDTQPTLDRFIPGTPVVIYHNYLWKRGTIVNNGDSVFLVDYGLSVKLVKNNLRQCPKDLLNYPMCSFVCQLVNVTKNKHSDPKIIMEKMTEVLKGTNLKIVGINNFEADIVGVELYNENKKIAYQPLIDSQLLIPK